MPVQVRDVVQFHRQAPVLHFADVAGGEFERAELPTEGHLLRVVEMLVAEHEHTVSVDRRVDRAHLVIRQRPGQVDADHHGGELGLGLVIDRFGVRRDDALGGECCRCLLHGSFWRVGTREGTSCQRELQPGASG